MADKGDRTEKPTQRRLTKARREGQFLVARHFVGAMQFLMFVALLTWGGRYWLAQTKEGMRMALRTAFHAEMGPTDLMHTGSSMLWRSFSPLIFAGGLIMLVTLAMQLAMTRFGFSLKKLAPDFKRLNPLARLRELRRQNIPALLQAIVMLPVFAAAVYFIVRDNLAAFMVLPLQSVLQGSHQVGRSLADLLWKAGGLFLVFGIVDLFRQQRRYQQDLRMSRQEIRDEVKELEGNPQMKGRIRRLRRDLLRRQMMHEVPKATAVVVNPTHYAVAIRYQLRSAGAPVVVAKGKNYLALRIRRKAVEHQVPLIENPPLAQALYKSAEVGQEIPVHLYRAVAEILAYIFRLMHGRLPA